MACVTEGPGGKKKQNPASRPDFAIFVSEYFDCTPITGQTRSCGTKDKITLKLSHLHTNHLERLRARRAAFGAHIGVALAELVCDA